MGPRAQLAVVSTPEERLIQYNTSIWRLHEERCRGRLVGGGALWGGRELACMRWCSP